MSDGVSSSIDDHPPPEPVPKDPEILAATAPEVVSELSSNRGRVTEETTASSKETDTTG